MSDISQEIIDEYKLQEIVSSDGSIFIMAIRGMYGLPQAGLLATELLQKRLNKNGYRQSKLVPGLWKHDRRPIQFTLVVDNFGVKYIGEEPAIHLKDTLEGHYKVTNDWTGNRYIGISLDWDYKRRQVHLSMPGPAWIRVAPRPSNNSITTNQIHNSMHHSCVHQLTTAPRNNTLLKPHRHQLWTKRENDSYNRCAASSSSSAEQSILLSSAQSAL
ncbi:hypothetical protein ACHAXR_001112 [Thalassiosira sp. AJA248-18]